MSSPGREVPAAAAASPPAVNDATSLAASPSPSIASHRQQQHPQFQPHSPHQQTAAPDAAASSTAALSGQDQQQQHHYDLGHSHHNSNDNVDAPSSSDHLPPFEPIFTLLTNTTTNTTVHPRVHYLFSDDDASAVLTAPQTDPSHRALIVDLAPPANPSGKWTVSWASSLTPDFAVTASQLSLQQHGSGSGNNDGDEGENNEGASTSVMLRVEGVEREGVPVDTKPTGAANLRSSSSSGGSGGSIVGRENVDQLTEEFKRRMGVLKKVVDEGERRRETLDRLNEEMATTHPDGRDDNTTTTTTTTAAAAAAVEDDTNAGGREPQ
ncbi:hypothetical protein M441DRAFT_60977 [Trichoderma asperellum CBS 433.97]|uniref:Uncharacterized protein n=1 Tax=Trichoderma asperellum (strain ATCC 204424 / CBS 433.97 / NBRC 101777) TaxID=1042311 RepID=A0A2T3YZ80_TRIA4|nr:hypothetical protein M441DRAFT_60977 [Trichoderma asperellum CBS 433.97]PTB37820.1 hypothetical protein M441DRAFT_60977 [Trichoderma asperellum CBS 433.97]